jgi:protein required for attachment to host cells
MHREDNMDRACIAIVDATRARLFTFERADDTSQQELTERADLVHPARHERGEEMFSDTRTGSARSGGGERHAYKFDDHRDAHVHELDARFARTIADELDKLIREARAGHVIVCASPHMLGLLRATALRRGGLIIDELPRDLSKLSIAQIRDQLAGYGLLPPRPPRPAISP